jgi:hypothetical protein
MTDRKDGTVVRPSTLPPNPSVGELVTEIDRARHDAVRTVNEIAGRLDVTGRVPRPVLESLRTAVQYAKQIPVPLRIAIVVVLWRSLRRRRRRCGR